MKDIKVLGLCLLYRFEKLKGWIFFLIAASAILLIGSLWMRPRTASCYHTTS